MSSFSRPLHLEEIGFVWDYLEHEWEKGFSYLKNYVEIHGNSLVPANFETSDGYKLGNWCRRQRRVGEKISLLRVKRLKALGFHWDKFEYLWEKNLSYLEAYRDEHNDRWPQHDYKTPDGFFLGRWVVKVRGKKDKLSPEKIQRLDELGFVWNTIEEAWNRGFAYLKTYHKEHNDCLVPSKFETSDGYKLGVWVGSQRTRRNKLTAEKIKRLDELGFAWNLI